MPEIPAHLATMRAITGTEEYAGGGDNTLILGFAREIGRVFPDMAAYAARYTHDEIPWCGLAVAYAFAHNGIRPVFGPTDTDKWLWAQAWKQFGEAVFAPQLGDVLVFARHVTLYDGEEGDYYLGRGGNQSDAITVAKYAKSAVQAIRRPPSATAVVAPSPIEHPLIMLGTRGPVVLRLQALLRVPATGVFDTPTDTAVRAFQASRGLEVDGEVGPLTWAALFAATATGRRAGLRPETIAAIIAKAGDSPVRGISWRDRGGAPIGYVKGMAVTFGHVYSKLLAGNSSAKAMAAAVPASDNDALEWYTQEFRNHSMTNHFTDAHTLRHLFVLLYGLGMRESSGRYCEGRDRSANNVTADTAEAGLFQQSWNSRFASPELPRLFAEYETKRGGFLTIFSEGITVRSGDLDNSGVGDGAMFQALAKACPAFAVEAAAIGLRHLRTHWGPIVRREVEISPFVDALFRDVQAIVDAQPIDGDVIPPTKLDDELLIAMIFILSQEGSQMDANLRAKMIVELGKPNPDLRALLLQALGAPPAIPPPVVTVPPPVPPVSGLPFDLGAILPLLQSPVIQKLMRGQQITLVELLPLLPAVLAIFQGHAVPALPPPGTTSIAMPVDPATPATPAAARPSVLLSMLGLVAGAFAQSQGTVGTPFGMGMEPTTAGTMTTLIPIVTGILGMFGGFGPIASIAGKIFGALATKK